MENKLKLGTRKSLLAWAQSGWVAREVERLNPGIQVELFGIETRGDRILDVSLQNVEGKEFFVAELDEALRRGDVDLTVHSMKDLSLERPKDFCRAAIPLRENPRDVILFGPGIEIKLAKDVPIRVGTSSPRRMENIPAFLEKALPRWGQGHARAELVEIRGNVNTRLARVQEPEGSARHLDAVVLAMAGLERLWKDETAHKELERLLHRVRVMVLPLRECPTAPGQGALAVECRAPKGDADSRIFQALSRLNDTSSAARVAQERALLADWGGGCHQRFGATVVEPREISGPLMWVRGKRPDGVFVEETRWTAPATPSGEIRSWNGADWRVQTGSERTTNLASAGQEPDLRGRSVFVAHARAVPENWRVAGARVWTSGVSSWWKLAERGIWVEGCAEGLGFAEMAATTDTGMLQLPKSWTVLTHEGAISEWDGRAEALPTYRVEYQKSQPSTAAQKALESATHIWWSSGSQYDHFGSGASAKAHHACGPGKTAAHLRAKGIRPMVFPSVQEWKEWIGK